MSIVCCNIDFNADYFSKLLTPLGGGNRLLQCEIMTQWDTSADKVTVDLPCRTKSLLKRICLSF
jgi:hypothetical protein